MESPLETFNVTLKSEQIKELIKAYYDRSEIRLVVKRKDLKGKYQLILSSDLVKEINQQKKIGLGLDITIPKQRIRQTLALIVYNELLSDNTELPNFFSGIFEPIYC